MQHLFAMWPSFWHSFDPYSLAGFKYLIDQLEEYQTVNDNDEGFVETLRLIAELVIYGDQHDPSIFEFFMEKQVMAQFLNILKVNNNSDVALQLLQTLNIMIQSLQSEHAIYYLFSNEYINNLITYPFDFQNEELIFYYISFLRTISGRLDKNTISLLVKTQHDAIISFPLYSEAIKFFNHQDSMICIAVRALTLCIYRVNDGSVNKFITSPPMSEYFSDLVKHLKQNTFKLDALVVRAAQVDDASDIKKMLVSTIEEIDDDLYYLSDILSASVSDLSRLVTQTLLHAWVFPMLLPSLHLSRSNSTQIRALTSLYILSRLLQVVNSKEVANTIGASFLCPPMVATTSFNCGCDQTKQQSSGISMVTSNTNNQTKEQASGISMINTNTHTMEHRKQHIVVKPSEGPSLNVELFEKSEKDTKSNVGSILPSFVSHENYKLVLASLSLLVHLLENKEMKKSLLEALGILPPKMQCQKLSEVFDSLIGLLSSRPPHGEAMWHVSWLFKSILPYLERKRFDHHLKVAETRFASNTIVLRRLIKVKDALTRMVTSANWTVWRQSNSDRATTIRGLILNESWWDRAEYLLKITEPILTMIRYTDMDRPCLGEVYDGIDSMIEGIRNIVNEKEQDPDEKFFKELQLIMIERWNKMTTPLHLLAFALSPRFYSQSVLKGSTTRVPPYRDPEVAQGYKAALRRLFPEHLRPAVRAEFMSFASTDDCGIEALEDKNNANAHKWWFYHGEKYQHLQPIAIKILSQAAYENASFIILNEINDSCCDLILKALLAEWKDCKRALEISALHKNIRFLLLPDSQAVLSNGSYSSCIVRERMLGAVQVFVLFHQVVNFMLRGTFPEIPPLDLIKEFPASCRAKCAGLDSVKVGVEVNLGDAIPCRIAFEEGKDMHVYMLAVVKGSHGWLLLAEEVRSKPHSGVVIAHAPLAGLKPKVDEIHPRWLHLRIRADLPSFGSKVAASGRYKTSQMSDGRWTLAFSDEQACKDANLMILDEMEIQKSFVKYALESLLHVDAIMEDEKESLKDFSST